MPKLKPFAFPMTAALLLLAGCSEVDKPAKPEESCDLCHSKPLGRTAAHAFHLAYPAMAAFPFPDESEAALMPVVATGSDTTTRYRVDSAFRFSNSATLDKATRYRQTGLLNHGIACTDCHAGLNGSLTRNDDYRHRDGGGSASFDEGSLRAAHYRASDTAHFGEYPGDMAYDGGSCSNIACHGAGRKGVQKVKWNLTSSFDDDKGCMTCHDTREHKVEVSCYTCHYDVTLDGKTIHNFRKHLNGAIDYGKY